MHLLPDLKLSDSQITDPRLVHNMINFRSIYEKGGLEMFVLPFVSLNPNFYCHNGFVIHLV